MPNGKLYYFSDVAGERTNERTWSMGCPSPDVRLAATSPSFSLMGESRRKTYPSNDPGDEALATTVWHVAQPGCMTWVDFKLLQPTALQACSVFVCNVRQIESADQSSICVSPGDIRRTGHWIGDFWNLKAKRSALLVFFCLFFHFSHHQSKKYE